MLFSDYHLSIQLTFSSPQNFHKTHSRKEAEREVRGSKYVLDMRGVSVFVVVGVICVLLTANVKFLIKQLTGRNT